MSELSLIPFGLNKSTKHLVDVSEVKRGKECDCICPSCKTPLIARKGSIKEWHFAHASKGTFSSTEKECEYSFWVSVILMAKQVLEAADCISLPAHTMYTNDSSEIKVSEETTIKLNDINIDKKINHISVDATLKLGSYILAVIFTAPHKIFEERINDITTNGNVGVLEISLHKAVHWLYRKDNKGKYTEALKEHIVNNINCKKWHYHPRQRIIEKQNNVTLNDICPIVAEPEDMAMYSIKDEHHTNEIAMQPVKDKNYKCVKCGKNWYGTFICSNCETHLFSTELKNA